MNRAAARGAAAFAAVLLAGAPAGAATPSSPERDGFDRVIVRLRGDRDLTAAPRAASIASMLRARATASQGPVRSYLSQRRAAGTVREVTSLWIVNALAVTAAEDVISELRQRSDVASVEPERVLQAPAALAELVPPEPNIELIGAPDLWDLGARGAGVVVASVDTGVDLDHPDLAGRWRGGSNSWFDPDGVYDEPVDRNGHGTATTGVMVGGASGGSAIGVAPGARWIAAKVFDDGGVATTADVHAAFQWILDPDGNPGTDDSPDVVNSSWTLGAVGCDLEFEPDLAALRAAGIVPVFAAGNSGPGASTSMSPANNPSALAVGGTTLADALWQGSSRGPTACGGSSGPYPELTAPGVQILSADRFGGYRTLTGTSLAAPHVAGAIALLLSAVPGTTPLEAEQAVLDGARDLGPAGADDGFGHGRLDLLSAYDELVPELRLLSLQVTIVEHRVRVKVRHSGCEPCRARARLRVQGEWRRRLLDTSGDRSVGGFAYVPNGRWSLRVTLRDLDTGRAVSSDPRQVRVR